MQGEEINKVSGSQSSWPAVEVFFRFGGGVLSFISFADKSLTSFGRFYR